MEHGRRFIVRVSDKQEHLEEYSEEQFHHLAEVIAAKFAHNLDATRSYTLEKKRYSFPGKRGWICSRIHILTPRRQLGVLAIRRQFLPPLASEFQDIIIVQMGECYSQDLTQLPTVVNNRKTAFFASFINDLSNVAHSLSAIEEQSGTLITNQMPLYDRDIIQCKADWLAFGTPNQVRFIDTVLNIRPRVAHQDIDFSSDFPQGVRRLFQIHTTSDLNSTVFARSPINNISMLLTSRSLDAAKNPLIFSEWIRRVHFYASCLVAPDLRNMCEYLERSMDPRKEIEHYQILDALVGIHIPGEEHDRKRNLFNKFCNLTNYSSFFVNEPVLITILQTKLLENGLDWYIKGKSAAAASESKSDVSILTKAQKSAFPNALAAIIGRSRCSVALIRVVCDKIRSLSEKNFRVESICWGKLTEVLISITKDDSRFGVASAALIALTRLAFDPNIAFLIYQNLFSKLISIIKFQSDPILLERSILLFHRLFNSLDDICSIYTARNNESQGDARKSKNDELKHQHQMLMDDLELMQRLKFLLKGPQTFNVICAVVRLFRTMACEPTIRHFLVDSTMNIIPTLFEALDFHSSSLNVAQEIACSLNNLTFTSDKKSRKAIPDNHIYPWKTPEPGSADDALFVQHLKLLLRIACGRHFNHQLRQFTLCILINMTHPTTDYIMKTLHKKLEFAHQLNELYAKMDSILPADDLNKKERNPLPSIRKAIEKLQARVQDFSRVQPRKIF